MSSDAKAPITPPVTPVKHRDKGIRIFTYPKVIFIFPTLVAAIICAIGMVLPFTWAGTALGFKPLPWTYWPLVAAMLLTYSVLTHFVNVWFTRRWGL